MIKLCDVVEASASFMERLYAGDVEWLRAALADDFTGIGAQADQYAVTKQEVLNVCVTVPNIVVENNQFRQILCEGDLCLVDGHFLAYVAPEERMSIGGESAS